MFRFQPQHKLIIIQTDALLVFFFSFSEKKKTLSGADIVLKFHWQKRIILAEKRTFKLQLSWSTWKLQTERKKVSIGEKTWKQWQKLGDK